MDIERITSNQNNRVKEWTKMQSKKGRVKSGEYVIEGWHIVDEAIRHRQTIKQLMVVDETIWAICRLTMIPKSSNHARNCQTYLVHRDAPGCVCRAQYRGLP